MCHGQRNERINTSLRGNFTPPAPATLDVLPEAVVGRAVLIVFLLDADTLDGLGVERNGALGDDGSKENDTGTDAELDTMETY